MQDFSNFNKQSSTESGDVYRDPLEEAKKDEKTEAPMLNQELATPAEEPHHESQPAPAPAPAPAEEPAPEAPAPEAEESVPSEQEQNPKLVEYLNTTRELLAFSRQKRREIIVEIDDLEDRVTSEKKDKVSSFESGTWKELDSKRSELRKKDNLINALLDVIRTIE